jgi:hypothetical protein
MIRNFPLPSSAESTSATLPPKVPTATEGQPANWTAGQPSNWSRTGPLEQERRVVAVDQELDRQLRRVGDEDRDRVAVLDLLGP